MVTFIYDAVEMWIKTSLMYVSMFFFSRKNVPVVRFLCKILFNTGKLNSYF